MEHKKDLGEFFKERLAGVEVEPKTSLWDSIEKTLDEKRKRGAGYIWIGLGLGLLLIVSSLLYMANTEESADKIAPTVKVPGNHPDVPSENHGQKDENQKVLDTPNFSTKNNRSESVVEKADEKDILVPGTVEPQRNKFGSSSIKAKKPGQTSEEDVFREKNEKNGRQSKKKQLSKDSKRSDSNSGNGEYIKEEHLYKNGEALPNQPKETEKKDEHPAAFDFSKKSLGENVLVKDSISILVINEKDTVSRDSTKSKRRPIRTLKSDSIVRVPIVEKEQNKYFLYPFMSTASIGRLSKGSSIDSRLRNNERNSSIGMGYGFYVEFEPNAKLAFRIGAAYNKMERNTINVPIDPNDLNTNFYKNVDFERNLSYESFANSFSEREMLVLKEKLGYLEVPMEVSYTFYQKKNFGIAAIGGIGVLFSKKNELSAIRVSGETTVLGKNGTYSLGSIGIHLGLGLNYQLSESIKIKFEPIIKPQIGFYEQSVGDNPFIFTVQLGARYKL